MRDLSKLMNPSSIAVVGASREPKKIGGIVMMNILASGFTGKLYPVNPKAEEVNGLACFDSVTDLPEPVDLVVVAIPSQFVNGVLEECGQKGIKNVVVFSAGYKEMGEEGKKLEEEMVEICDKYEINLLGPNCLGFTSTLAPVNVTFGQVIKNRGRLRFVSQSGAIAASMFDWVEANGLGFAEYVTLGNKAVLSENDFLEYWLDQGVQERVNNKMELLEGESELAPVGMYLESVDDGEKFVKLVSQMSVNNPVLVLKPGKSEAAARAMQSHTGAMAGSDAVLTQALEQFGAIRCEGVEDMFDLARAFTWERVPEGPNMVIVSNAGGPAVISTDFVAETSLKLAPIDDGIYTRLKELLPPAASVVNPVDVLGDALANRYRDALDTVLAETRVHGVVVILTPQVMTEIEETAHVVAEMSAKYGKPIMCSFMGESHISAGEAVLNKAKVPSFRYPERAIKALAAMWEWQEKNKKLSRFFDLLHKPGFLGGELNNESSLSSGLSGQMGRVDEIVRVAMESHRQSLDSSEASEVLADLGIRVPADKLVATYEDASKFVSEVGFPVVLKLSSPKLLHKKDVGGVAVGIGSFVELGKKWEELWQARERLEQEIKETTMFLVQKQVATGVEVIVGVKRDPSFGPVVMFGAGGTLAELVRDRNLLLWPAGSEQARNMVEKSKVNKLLAGFRGEEGYDASELVSLIGKLGDLVVGVNEIAEAEINPVIVNRDGVWAVDGKVVLRSESQITNHKS